MARLEARIALRELFSRTRDMALEPGASLEPCQGFIVHGVTRLPVTFQPAGG